MKKICEVAGCGDPSVGGVEIGKTEDIRIFGIFKSEDYRTNASSRLCLKHFEICYRSILELLKNE